MYQKILAEAVRELKRSDFKELFQEEISQQDDLCTGLYHRYRFRDYDS